MSPHPPLPVCEHADHGTGTRITIILCLFRKQVAEGWRWWPKTMASVPAGTELLFWPPLKASVIETVRL